MERLRGTAAGGCEHRQTAGATGCEFVHNAESEECTQFLTTS